MRAVFHTQTLCSIPALKRFRFRFIVSVYCRFPVHDDTDVSLDELSDCSSDSMEVCCDDVGELSLRLSPDGVKC